MNKLIFVSMIAGVCMIFSCKTKAPATSEKAPVAKNECGDLKANYAADIKIILDTKCGGATGCHSAQKHAHGVDLSSYESSKSAASHKSFLGSIRHEAGFHPMPDKKPKLDDETIAKIVCWVSSGMPQ